MVIHIEPLGTNVILPAVVVGFEITEAHLKSAEFSPPDWFVVLDQQAGGHCMSYPSVGGAVLRLTDNKAFLTEPDVIIRGFRAMAEDPDMKVLRDYPDLEKLVLTRGDSYSKRELSRLSRFVRRFGKFPDLESGIEAFTRFQDCDLVEMFGGWITLHADAPDDLQSVYRLPHGLWVDESNLQHLKLSVGDAFSNDHLTALQNLSSALEAENPRAYFLWENSD